MVFDVLVLALVPVHFSYPFRGFVLLLCNTVRGRDLVGNVRGIRALPAAGSGCV